MAQMQALLKIKADVTGEGAVQGLATKLGGLGSVASRVGGGLKGLAGAAGGLGGALGALVPAASVAGLAAMAKGAIDTADNLAKMSAKTGVSVEQLSKFKQAADLGGSSIEAVTGAMLKLNKGLAEGSGPASKALDTLGISATDASGKLKSTDKIMLEVADKFKAMPDGAEKSALAMQLFGKSGAEMIPMLNGGSKAIDGLNATMSTKFAKGAEVFNDRITTIQGKLMELGVKLADVLMPAFNAITAGVEALIGGISQLPGPIQAVLLGAVALTAAFVLLAPAISAVISIAGALAGLKLGATIAGWLGAVGPAIIGMKAAFIGLMAWITGTLLPFLAGVFSGPVGWTILAVAAVVAMCILFRKPIMNFFTWLGGAIGEGLKALWKWHEPIRKFWLDAFGAVGAVFKQAMDAIGAVLRFAFQAWFAIVYQLWVQPWINLWNNVLREPAAKMLTWIQGIWKGITDFFGNNVIKPIQSGWNMLMQTLPNAMRNVLQSVQSAWSSMINGIKGGMRNVLQYIAGNINTIGGLVNNLIGAFNKLPGPDIPMVPKLTVPAFADGGVVSRPTLAMVGEGGEAEYIIPESKMAAASSSYLAGARGADVMRSAGAAGTTNAPVINVQTGPVVEFNGERYVTLGDFERGLQQVASSVINGLRTPAGRYATGVR